MSNARRKGVRLAWIAWLAAAAPAEAALTLGPEELVRASGVEIVVPGYSVPSFVFWDGDGLRDLVVGEGASGIPGKVRVYRNVGSEANPEFEDLAYVQSEGSDLVVTGFG